MYRPLPLSLNTEPYAGHAMTKKAHMAYTTLNHLQTVSVHFAVAN